MSQSIPEPLRCPFCGAKLSPPARLSAASYENSDGGSCVCGAVFAFDPTSHNLGRAMLDAYCYAAGDPGLALELDPAHDLDEAVVRGYDEKRNVVMAPKSPSYQGAGSLYFVRLRPGVSSRLESIGKASGK